jgi:hypothetical protein
VALLVPQNAAAGLQDVVFSPATGGGDTCPVGARVGGWDMGHYLLVRNTDAATKTVTVNGIPFVIPATTGIGFIPIVAPTGYNQAVKPVSYSAVTNLSVGVVRAAPPP